MRDFRCFSLDPEHRFVYLRMEPLVELFPNGGTLGGRNRMNRTGVSSMVVRAALTDLIALIRLEAHFSFCGWSVLSPRYCFRVLNHKKI
jgi:hypothetical protein